MFDADRPITKSTEDHLNRAPFAKYLARCILDYQDTESLVVGLYGGFGVGKTSVINLILEELNFAASNMDDAQKPIILNFSVWSYSGQNQLIYSFFRRLSSTLRSVDYLENADKIIHLLELYASFFTNKPVPKSLQKKNALLDKFIATTDKENVAWESGRDLTQVKLELNQLLAKQQHKIIIIIDNISRLYPNEIKEMFQIIKSMADYANTAYLLAFDKEQVIHALNRIDDSGGLPYLEKIVQLPFEIPPILQQDLENILADRLKEVMTLVPLDAWDTEYWADIYYNHLKYFFENCRDITRYVNTLNFAYPRLVDLVNPVDFFALTALEVFAPNIYYSIRNNKDLFTDLLQNVYVLDAKQIEEEKLRIQAILAKEHRLPHELILSLLIRLFPRLKKIYEPKVAFYHSDTLLRKLKRICAPDLFDIYFRLSMQNNQLIPSEFNAILALASDEKSFDQALMRLNQDDRSLKFLAMLDSTRLQNIPKKDIESIISVLLDNGDLFPIGIVGRLSLNTPMRIHHIIHGLLKHFSSPDERYLIMQNAIAKASKSLYIIIHELNAEMREHLEESDTFMPLEFRDLTPEQLSSLKKLCVSRIENWANTGRLDDHPQLLAILSAWFAWGEYQAMQNYLIKLTSTDKGLLTFLTQVFRLAIDEAMSTYKKNLRWEQYLNELKTLISPARILEHAKILFESDEFEKLREREQLALMIFLDLMHAKTVKIIPGTN